MDNKHSQGYLEMRTKRFAADPLILKGEFGGCRAKRFNGWISQLSFSARDTCLASENL